MKKLFDKLMLALQLVVGSSVCNAADSTKLGRQARTAANLAVEQAKKFENLSLDYSPESVKHVNKLLLGYKADGATPEQAPNLVYIYGCYLGEVMIRNKGGNWQDAAEALKMSNAYGIGVLDNNSTLWNPIGKVEKLLKNGEEDNLSSFYGYFEEKNR